MHSTKTSHQNKKAQRLPDKYFVYSILLCFCIAFFTFIYFIIAGNGAFTLRDDFNTQQLTFANQVNGFLKQGNVGEWCWNLDIGTSFVNGFGFYVLGSPFFWITYLFPRTMLPYLIGWLFMLKYCVAGGTAYLFFKTRTGKGGWQEVFGSVLYAFSGFSAAAIEFYHFHDVVALFPLMLIGIEKLIKDKNTTYFTLAVFINCLVNYYFFIGECLFCILYFVFRHFSQRDSFISDTVRCLICGVFGVGMAAVLFVPSIIYILANPRSTTHLSWRTDMLPGLKELLYFAKGILLPGEAMNNQSAIFNAEWNSTACWLPLCGISLCIAYVLRKRDSLSHFLLLLTAIAFSPFLSSGFSLFTRNYQRWWYMFALVGALACVNVLRNVRAYPVKAGLAINAVILILYYAGVWYLNRTGSRGTLIWHPRRFLFLVLVSLAGLAYMYIGTSLVHRFRAQFLIAGVSLAACVMTAFTIYIYRIDSESTESIMGKYALAGELEVIDEQYRYELENNRNLITLTGDIAGVGAFTSTCSNYRFELNDMFEYSSTIFSLRKDEHPGLSALFGAKFVITEEMPEDAVFVNAASKGDTAEPAAAEGGSAEAVAAVEGGSAEAVAAVEGEKTIVYDHVTVKGKDYYVTEQPACPIGYAVDSYILKSDLMNIDLSERGLALVQAAVINEEDEAKVESLLKKVTAKDLDLSGVLTGDADVNSAGDAAGDSASDAAGDAAGDSASDAAGDSVSDAAGDAGDSTGSAGIIGRNLSRKVNDFHRDSHGLSCTTDYAQDSMVFFSVPNDPGWVVTIDGTVTETINTGGLVLLPVSAGNHEISFEYRTPGLRIGALISAVSALLFAAYTLIGKRHHG